MPQREGNACGLERTLGPRVSERTSFDSAGMSDAAAGRTAAGEQQQGRSTSPEGCRSVAPALLPAAVQREQMMFDADLSCRLLRNAPSENGPMNGNPHLCALAPLPTSCLRALWFPRPLRSPSSLRASASSTRCGVPAQRRSSVASTPRPKSAITRPLP